MTEFLEKQDELLRRAPSNVKAEQLLLGAILINNEVLARVGSFLQEEHFYEPVHGRIYKTILLIIDKGVSASPVSLKNIFDKDDALEGVGGAEYLSKLVMMATTVVNAYEYAKIIYDLAIRRKLIFVGEEIVNDAFSNDLEESEKQIEKAESHLYQLSQSDEYDKGFSHLADSITESIQKIDRVIKNPSSVSGITTGYIDLDAKLSGFQNSDLVIIAGRPSMGKTAFAINLAFNAAYELYEKNKEEKILPSVGFLSLEMPAEQLSTRLLSMKAEIESSLLTSGRINEADYNKLRLQGEILSKIPIFIDDTPALSIASIRAKARRLKRRHNLGMLFVDYLQLVRGTAASIGNRVLEIGEITQGLKAIAKELNIPVIALSQLSRAVEQREDKKPLLSDLRESGSIEQDADIVMFLYREEYYLLRQQPEPGGPKHDEWAQKISKAYNKLEIVIAKHRNGPIGEVPLYYEAALSKIANASKN